MKNQPDLFSGSSEHTSELGVPYVKGQDVTAGRIIPGEIVFESTETGVRVTARDDEHRLLWGYIASKETLRLIHCSVAMYSTLQSLIEEELQKSKHCEPEGAETLASAVEAVRSLEGTLRWIQNSIDVKDVKSATLERARALARIVADADRQIMLEACRLKGMKPKGEATSSM